MKIWKGKSVSGGIAIGPAVLFEKEESTVKRISIENTEREKTRFQEAQKEAEKELTILYEKALKEVGESGAMIFDTHRMILFDADYTESVLNMIETQRINAEFAVASTGDNFSHIFSSMEDEYMRERATDIRDISNRIVRILQGKKDGGPRENTPIILLAEDLTPSETVQLDKSLVLAFVTRKGSANSHTAILARTMNIPALTGIELPKDIAGKTVIVDGYEGLFIEDPDEESLAEYRKKQKNEENKKELLQNLKGKETVTKDGRKIQLYANIGGISDVALALSNDAAGIGLFRSEFLYIGRDDCPTEEEQFNTYKTVIEMMAGKKVIIRTLDIGADKQAPCFHLDKEENPAMGYRAIRLCLDRPDVLKTQLRAIYRAACYGSVSVMFPMITSVTEIRQIRRIQKGIVSDLKTKEIPFAEPETGIMIETPAAALISDLLAKEVDFFSIGTNDLTQYTLAIDRQNPHLDAFYDPHHEAVLRMIRMVVDNGHKHGCWVGICGELAGDKDLVEAFVDMGIDELSVTPSLILNIRNIIRNI